MEEAYIRVRCSPQISNVINTQTTTRQHLILVSHSLCRANIASEPNQHFVRSDTAMATVDTSIDSSASGAAAALVHAHSADHSLKLYGGWFCPFVQRAWVVLEEKKIPHQYIEINPYHKAPEFLALNPRGLVPTLGVPVDAKGSKLKPLYESIVICEYLDEAYPGPRLLPEDPYERARCRLWIDHAGSKIVPGFYKMMQHTPDKPYSIEEARAELHKNIKMFVEEMDDGGPWFLGERFSMVDIMPAPCTSFPAYPFFFSFFFERFPVSKQAMTPPGYNTFHPAKNKPALGKGSY